MITDAIAKLADRADLSEKEAEEVMLEIMTGAATSAQIAAYLMGLRIKVETVDEIVGSVRAMRSRATHIRVADPLVVDTCRSEEHTSELQSRLHLVCRLLLEKKKRA